MTVIACNREMMAGDRRFVKGGIAGECTKVFEIDVQFSIKDKIYTEKYVLGFAGFAYLGHSVKQWIEHGMVQDEFPKIGEEEWIEFILYNKNTKELLHFENCPIGIPVEEEFCAIGHARATAITLMHIGKTPKEAVEIASTFDIYCGNGVDVVYFEVEPEAEPNNYLKMQNGTI